MGKKEDEKKKKKKKKGKTKTWSRCENDGLRRGAWSVEEDKILVHFITQNGHGTWRNLPKLAGLRRCGKSCRLRWTNYLRPDIRRGPFTLEEENTIIQLHETLGNKWAVIASQLSGRTDNDVKNFWNSHLRKRFAKENPVRHPSAPSKAKPKSPLTNHTVQWESIRVEAESRLSTKPLPAPTISPKAGDYFINLWNSKVGQSFRNADEFNPQSPTSQTSSLTKAESCKKTGSPEVIWECKKEPGDLNLMAYSDTSKSYDQMDDSSDAMMKLLLDFPVGDDDMGFLQEENNNDVSNYV